VRGRLAGLVRLVLPIVAFGLAPLAAQPPATVRDPRALLAGSACREEALDTLASWSARLDQGLAEPPGPTGARGIRMPTATIGVWARLTVEPGGAATLERVTAGGVDIRRFGPSCRAEMDRREAGLTVHDRAFTDEALAARLAEGDAGVILLWSPHMPLSVDEHAELQAAAAGLKLSVAAVLDPAADPDYARRVARERGLPDSVLQPLASVELAFRGMTTHAPSVQVFAEGRLVGPVLYGYRDRATARLAIEAVLASR
jgi:hypothetical protein